MSIIMHTFRKLFLLGVILAAFSVLNAQEQTAGTFTIDDDTFLLNGEKFKIYSGELHYPRIPREYWRDRLEKARAMGLNTVSTYIFWNLHEPLPGQFTFSGNLDVAEFVRIAQDVGLWVILRPGPYVCSEWDLGGIPSWLLRDRDITLRGSDPRYVNAGLRYLKRLGRELAPLQIDSAGPVIMVQVENEYGSYGNDKGYMATMEAGLRTAGFHVPLFTSDGPAAYLLESGALPGILPVVNFGGRPERAFDALSEFRDDIPHMTGEYWCGWFTHWGDSSWGGSNTATQAEELRWMVENGKSFNLYMFHGGTNFGWTAGANFGPAYGPDVTSYDYDAPLDEMGNPTEKYFAFRDVLKGVQPEGVTMPDMPWPQKAMAIPEIRLNHVADLFSSLAPPLRVPQPKSMEELGQDYGLILYRTRLLGPKHGRLTITEPHDFALVYLDGVFIDTLNRMKGETSIMLPQTEADEPVLDILVEAMGRINFGQHLKDRKGITERVTLRGVTLMGWEVFQIRLREEERARMILNEGRPHDGPRFFAGTFVLNDTSDTFLDMSAWSKGMVWVNGKHLGRYWDIGPQHRLYVPGPWLRKGENDIFLLDLFEKEPMLLSGKTSAKEL
jgi:beta-galactosidase GanA